MIDHTLGCPDLLQCPAASTKQLGTATMAILYIVQGPGYYTSIRTDHSASD